MTASEIARVPLNNLNVIVDYWLFCQIKFDVYTYGFD